jgi:hypothetical protein
MMLKDGPFYQIIDSSLTYSSVILNNFEAHLKKDDSLELQYNFL